MTNTADRPTWAMFTIATTTTERGVVCIDPDRWQAIRGQCLTPAAVTVGALRQYVAATDGGVVRIPRLDGAVARQETWSGLVAGSVADLGEWLRGDRA